MGPSSRGRHSHSFDIRSRDTLMVSHVSDNTYMFVASYLLSGFSNLRPISPKVVVNNNVKHIMAQQG